MIEAQRFAPVRPVAAPIQGPLIVVFDEDAAARAALCRYFEDQGFTVAGVGDLGAMDGVTSGEPVNLVILCARAGGHDTSALCRRLSQDGRLPLIVTIPMIDDLDRILCLELGADDVLSQPVNPRELLARMRAVIRRRSRMARRRPTGVFRFAGFRFDPSRRELWSPADALVLLTATEANLLRILLSQGEHRLGRDELAAAARVVAREGGRALDLHVSRLRRKLEDGGGRRLILTHRNLGYQMACPVVLD